MLSTDQKNSILYLSQVWVADTGYEIVEKEQYSEPCDSLYDKAFLALNYIQVLTDPSVDNTLSIKEQEHLYAELQDMLNLQNYPVAVLPFTLVESVQINVGSPGDPGLPGSPGANGTDADIDVVSADDDLTVVESVVMGVKTFTLTFTPYIAPTITVALDDADIPDPDQNHVVETGTIIPSLDLIVTLDKNRDNVTSSALTVPGGLAATYAPLVNLTTINTVGIQVISMPISNVSVTTTYTVNISDGTTVNVDSDTVTFVYPYLYGSTASTSISHYIDLSKRIKTQANQVINFSGTVQYFWFGYPTTYGSLVQVLDQNGFDVTSGFTILTPVSVTATGLDSNWTINYTFYRTTLATTISNANYTFKFS